MISSSGAMLAGMLLAGAAQAQQVTEPIPPTPAAGATPPVEDVSTQAVPPPVQGSVTTLGEVRALEPEDDQPLDLGRFQNPVQPESNRFSRSWSGPPTPEQVSMNGGYLMMGINYGLAKAAQGLHELSCGRAQIQSAVVRPPPELIGEQQRRAARCCETSACDEGGDANR